MLAPLFSTIPYRSCEAWGYQDPAPIIKPLEHETELTGEKVCFVTLYLY